jgi:hypothetical protein
MPFSLQGDLVLVSLVSENTDHVLQATPVVQVGQTVSKPLQSVSPFCWSPGLLRKNSLSQYMTSGFSSCNERGGQGLMPMNESPCRFPFPLIAFMAWYSSANAAIAILEDLECIGTSIF